MKNKDMTLFFWLCGICTMGICVGIIASQRAGSCAEETVLQLYNIKEFTLSLKEMLLNDALSSALVIVAINLIPVSVSGFFIWGGLILLRGFTAGFSYFQLFLGAGIATALKIAFGAVLPSLAILAFMCRIGSKLLCEEKKDGRFARILNRSYYTALFVLCICIRCVIQYGLFYKF